MSETTAIAAEQSSAEVATPNVASTNIMSEASLVSKPDYIPEKFWNKDKNEPNIEGLAKSYKELESRMGTTRPTVPDFEKATPEEQKEFWKSLGAGESVDDYQVNIPEGLTPDENFLNGFKQFSLENNIPKSIAGKLADWYIGQQVEATQAWNAHHDESKKALQEEWGTSFKANLDGSYEALVRLAGEKQAKEFQSRYGNDVGFIKLMHNISQRIGEDKVSEPTTNMNKANSSKAELREEYMKLKNSPDFWNVKGERREHVVKRIGELQAMDIWSV